MTDYKLVPVERCVACRTEKPVSEMETCMHNQMHRYVCDMTCMNDFYNPPKKQSPDADAPAAQVSEECPRCKGKGRHATGPIDCPAMTICKLCSAPAVQWEPVAYMYADECGRTKIVLGKETAEHWCPPDETVTPLYTAQQPAEQQPAQDVAGLQAELERERNRRFDGNEQASRDHREDVSALVEALEWLRGAINATPENDKAQTGIWISTKHPRIKQIDAILAAYRNQGGES